MLQHTLSFHFLAPHSSVAFRLPSPSSSSSSSSRPIRAIRDMERPAAPSRTGRACSEEDRVRNRAPFCVFLSVDTARSEEVREILGWRKCCIERRKMEERMKMKGGFPKWKTETEYVYGHSMRPEGGLRKVCMFIRVSATYRVRDSAGSRLTPKIVFFVVDPELFRPLLLFRPFFDSDIDLFMPTADLLRSFLLRDCSSRSCISCNSIAFFSCASCRPTC